MPLCLHHPLPQAPTCQRCFDMCKDQLNCLSIHSRFYHTTITNRKSPSLTPCCCTSGRTWPTLGWTWQKTHQSQSSPTITVLKENVSRWQAFLNSIFFHKIQCMYQVHKLQCRRTCDFKNFNFKKKNLALFRWLFGYVYIFSKRAMNWGWNNEDKTYMWISNNKAILAIYNGNICCSNWM